jgi:hypothetical protein
MSADAVARCMAPLLLRAMFVGEIYPGGNEKDSTGSYSGSQQLGSDMLTAMSAASTAVDLTVALIKSYDTVFEVGI